MPLSHEELIIKSDDQLLKAISTLDLDAMYKLCHKNLVLTNEVGKTFFGVQTLELLQRRHLTIDEIHILHRDLVLYGGTAVVNSLERRSGSYRNAPLRRNYHLTRVWKFQSSWQLISTTSVLVV